MGITMSRVWKYFGGTSTESATTVQDATINVDATELQNDHPEYPVTAHSRRPSSETLLGDTEYHPTQERRRARPTCSACGQEGHTKRSRNCALYRQRRRSASTLSVEPTIDGTLAEELTTADERRQDEDEIKFRVEGSFDGRLNVTRLAKK